MHTPQFKVSAIIPAYNCEKTLERAFYSLINQISPPIEIIIINNNSTDQTQQVIEKLKEAFPLQVICLHEKKVGANYARNLGIQKAKGNWIQLLDADDELGPHKILNQLKIIELNPEADVVYSAAKYYIDTSLSQEFKYFKSSKVDPDPIVGLIESKLGRTLSNLWRKEALEKVGIFDVKISSSQEYFLMLKLFLNGARFILDSNSESKVFVQKESISQTQDPNKLIKILLNKLIFGQKIKNVITDRNIWIKKYDFLIKKRATQEFYGIYLLLPSEKEKLLTIKQEFNLHFPTKQIIKIFLYHVHNKYNFKIPFIRYFTLVYFSFVHMDKLKVK